MCKAFGDCPPDVAERQDPQLVREIFEYRAAMFAKGLGDGTDADKKYLAEHPEAAAMLKVLHDTQRELYLKPGLVAAIETYRAALKEQD